MTSTLVIVMKRKVKQSFLFGIYATWWYWFTKYLIFNYWASQNPWVCQFKARDIWCETRTLWQWRHWHCSFSNKIEVWNVTLLKYEIFLGAHSTKSEKKLLKSHVTAINSIFSEMCYKPQIISDCKQTNVTMWCYLFYSFCKRYF